MNAPVLQLTLRELQEFVARPRLWIVFAVVVALFTASGPFGTYDRLPFATRLGYWLANHALSWSCALFFVTLFNVALERRIGHSLPRMLVGAAVASLPIGAVIAGLNTAVMNVPLTGAQYLAGVSTALPVSLALCLIVWLSMDAERPREGAAPEAVVSLAGQPVPQAPAVDASPLQAAPATPPRPALLDRLPGDKRGTLIRLEVQDHYVLVVTSRGREMVLMRLADAIRETEPVDGLQVHRSHWIARDGVAEIIREPGKNGRTLLRTTDGAEVPVSRGNVADVKGWVG